jgi:hypothetical protein
VVIGAGDSMLVYAADAGALRFRGVIPAIAGRRPAIFFGAPTIVGGVVFEGDSQGVLYAWSLP